MFFVLASVACMQGQSARDAEEPEVKVGLLARSDSERGAFAGLAGARKLWLSAEELASIKSRR